MKTRCLVSPERWTDEAIELDAGETHHLLRVLRLNAGATVEVLDGHGRIGQGILEPMRHGIARVRITGSKHAPPATPEIVLVVTWLKPGRFEWLLEKATELGVADIRLIETEYSASQAASQLRSHQTRFETIVNSALKQSGNPWRLHVRKPVPLAVLLAERPASAMLWYGAVHGSAPKPFAPAPAPYWLVIGPEGGLSPAEEEALCAVGGEAISLGPTVLRAETAALALTAVCQACRWKGPS